MLLQSVFFSKTLALKSIDFETLFWCFGEEQKIMKLKRVLGLCVEVEMCVFEILVAESLKKFLNFRINVSLQYHRLSYSIKSFYRITPMIATLL